VEEHKEVEASLCLKYGLRLGDGQRAWLFRKWLKMVIIHFLPFTTVSVIHSESMPSKLTKTPKEELKPFYTNLGIGMRAIVLFRASFSYGAI